MTKNNSYIVEHAQPEDAGPILLLKRATWLETYVNKDGGITAEDIYKKFPDSSMPASIEGWQKGIAKETEDGHRMTFVVKQNGEVAGFTCPLIEDGKHKIGAMYVSPEYQGVGIGSALMERALEWLGQENDVYLKVVSYNQNAIDFYKGFGFIETGVSTPLQYDEEQDIKLLPEIEMVLKAHTA